MAKFYKWKNTVKANLNPIVYQGNRIVYNWVGWCLAVAQTALKAGWAGSTAIDGWRRVKGKHSDTKIPTGVYVPLWFSGFYNMGHVLIVKMNSNGKSGTAWTSPNDAKPYMDVLKFSSIPNLVAQLRRGWAADTVYLGWSEYMGSTRVIKKTAYKRAFTARVNVRVRNKPSVGALPSGSRMTKKGKKFYAVEVVRGGAYVGHDGKKHTSWLKSQHGNYTARHWYK